MGQPQRFGVEFNGGVMEGTMNEIEQLERTVSNLSPEDLAQFRAWFFEFEARVWDQQIEAGKLNRLIAEARAEFEQGKARPL